MIPVVHKLNIKSIPTTLLRRSSGVAGGFVTKKNCYSPISTQVLLTKSTPITTTMANANAANTKYGFCCRSFTTSTTTTTTKDNHPLVLTELDPSNGIATLTLNHGSVNSLSLELYVKRNIKVFVVGRMNLFF